MGCLYERSPGLAIGDDHLSSVLIIYRYDHLSITGLCTYHGGILVSFCSRYNIIHNTKCFLYKQAVHTQKNEEHGRAEHVSGGGVRLYIETYVDLSPIKGLRGAPVVHHL